ncbi:MAG TPA: ribokinase [Magnetospirillaceae bacterium]|jgi:ribokinase
MAAKRIVIMGIFVADTAYRTPYNPPWGETVLGSDFKLGPGGKGSNQAVASARAGGNTAFITKLGRDTFGDMARKMYSDEGIDQRFVVPTDEHATGAAAIIIDEKKGDNAIIVFPGACSHLSASEVDAAKEIIQGAACFMTNLELPVPIVLHGLKLARSLGTPTILNPAPAVPVPTEIFPLCDYATPNEHEAEGLTGIKVNGLPDAEKAADALLAKGVKNAVITLGGQGVFIKNASVKQHIDIFKAGPVVETTGAGDAFNGGFAVALAEGKDIVEACRFGCAVAGISVTRKGTAPSMPKRSEVDALLGRK